MNKIYITTIITLTSIAIVNAQNVEGIKKQMIEKTAIVRQIIEQEGQTEMTKITTGDANIDNQVMILNQEMEDKIQLIHDEYRAKIKAVIGDKKLIRISPTGEIKSDDGLLGEVKKLSVKGTSTTPVTILEEIKELQSKQDNISLIKNFLLKLLGVN